MCSSDLGELASLEEEAASRTGGEGSNGVETAQNARIAQLKAQVRQQAPVRQTPVKQQSPIGAPPIGAYLSVSLSAFLSQELWLLLA